MKTWSDQVVLCSNHGRLAAKARERLRRNGVTIRTTPITRLDHDGGALKAITFGPGDSLPSEGVKAAVAINQALQRRELRP